MSASERHWDTQVRSRQVRLQRAAAVVHDTVGKKINAKDAVELLEAIVESGDRVCIEGNNQKQADFLARALTQIDSRRVHDLHMVQSVLALPEHLDLFELGIASRLDFSYSGPQGPHRNCLTHAADGCRRG